MSAFFIAINKHKRPFSRSVAEKMMWAIEPFGHDVSQLVIEDHIAVGYQGRWSVPEEIGEKQPLRNARGLWFVFHGRVDNRSCLLAKLGLPDNDERSDAALTMDYLDTFGQAHLVDIVGPFVMVSYDPKNDVVVAARDGMGGRYLCYANTDDQFVLTTYELCVVASRAVPYCLNIEKAARILVNEMEPQPSSTIQGIEPLRPGERLVVSGEQQQLDRFYSPDPKRRIVLESDAAYAREFRRLLDQAVKRRLRTVGAVGTMLSGGLDSVPMTISAAMQSDSPVAAFSWVFEKYPELDERRFSSPICTFLNIPHHHINCDHLWPAFDDDTYVNPVFPFGIPYSEFQQETFRRAKSVGVTTLLTGIHGDVLYGYTLGIIYELLRSGRFRMAFKEARALWRGTESKRAFVKHYLIKPLAPVQLFLAWRNRRRPYSNHCLQDDVAALLVQHRHWLDQESRAALRPQQWRVVFDHFAGEDAAYGRYMDAKFGIERRYPFRDRELCEFILAIPSDQLFANSSTRPIVKRAYRAELTQDILTRNDKTDFGPRINAGIEIDDTNTAWFETEQPAWAQFVKKCYFMTNNEQKQRVNVTRWRCGYYDYWKSVCYNRVTNVLGNINSESDNKEITGS